MSDAADAPPWREAKAPDGRTYYYNSKTNETTWSKPDDLMTPAERAPENWQEAIHNDGRKYWYNTVLKTSVWKMPACLQAPSRNQTRAQMPVPQFVAGGPATYSTYYQNRDQNRDRDDHFSSDRSNDRFQSYGQRDGNRPDLTQVEHEYASLEEQEAAFFKLLKKTGVQQDWTWDRAMRATITDPLYFKTIKDPKDRSSAFEKYIAELKSQEKDKEQERQARLKTDFTMMLKSHPEIKYYTRWKTARPILEGETVFRSAKNDDERRALFNEYRNELYRAHEKAEAETQKLAREGFTTVLTELNLEPYTRWAEALEEIQTSETFLGDEKFELLPKSDILRAFEEHIKALEVQYNDHRQKQKKLRARRERQNRDQFLNLLMDLRAAGKIKAGTKWVDIHPLIEDDPRYLNVLGQPGSTPLDLFWDKVEEEERSLRAKKHDVMDVLETMRYEMTPQTTFAEFIELMSTDRRTATVDTTSMQVIFDRLMEKVVRRSEENKYLAERKQRHAIDALRSKIKHLEPPVQVGDTWEQVRARIQDAEEYSALDSEELRRSAYDKVMRRVKEKKEDQEREQSRRGQRDRERVRDYRDRHPDTHRRRTRTRSPEPDPYEADRKKAQADRERNYRKHSNTGLSPPASRFRERGERDRYEPRGGRLSDSHYERERRARDSERERSYISRADPRDKSSELDYGDSRPGNVRRRRESDAASPDSRRDGKRLRRDGRDSREITYSPRAQKLRTPVPASPPAPKDEEPALRSGSEEGEIEED